MRRCLLPLLAVFVLTAGAAPAPSAEAELKIRWHGQSMFQIVTSKGTRVVLDPHNIEVFKVADTKCDLLLMSHFHTDHTTVDKIVGVKDPKKVKQFNALKKDGERITWNTVDTKFKDVGLETVGTYHDTESGFKRGLNGVWILKVDGMRIVHLGDLGHKLTPKQVKAIGTKMDVLMIPVGGVYTLNGIVAQEVVEQLQPTRYVLPMHYGNVVFDDVLPVKYFLDEQPEKTEVMRFPLKKAAPKGSKKKLETIDWLSIPISPKTGKPLDKAPDKYKVALLHWSTAEDEKEEKKDDKKKDEKKEK